MSTDTMDPATAVTYGPFIQAAEAQYSSDPSQVNPGMITNMPVGYTLARTIQMTDFFGPEQSRVFYGYVAVGGNPTTAVVALRGTESTMEWWDDFHWDLVPFTQIPAAGKVAQGFYDIYNSIGTMAPGQQGTSAPSAVAADVAQAATSGPAAGIDPASLPLVVTGHSLGGALATLLVADLNATTALQPQAWTFASPQVGDATFGRAGPGQPGPGQPGAGPGGRGRAAVPAGASEPECRQRLGAGVGRGPAGLGAFVVAWRKPGNLLVGVYTGIVLLATEVLQLRSSVAVAVATLAAVALFNPVRRRVQRMADRRFNRARYDADRIAAAFAARLQDAVDLDAVRADLAGSVQQALEPAHVSVWIQAAGTATARP